MITIRRGEGRPVPYLFVQGVRTEDVERIEGVSKAVPSDGWIAVLCVSGADVEAIERQIRELPEWEDE